MKVTKEIANYEEPSCSGDTCGNCIYFQELEVHHCARVEGIIKPDAICKLFEPAFTLRG